MTVNPESLKASCCDAYAGLAAGWLLGDTLHPGGAALTLQLASALAVGPGDTVVDVASGPGTSAIQVARETGCDVVGIELAAESVGRARRAAEQVGLDGQVRFVQGDAEGLPLPDASADGALCECSLCLFPDKERAVGEVVRVLRPGARLALSDVTADAERLPVALCTLAGWVSCLAGAHPLEGTADLLESAGLVVETIERHDQALAELLVQMDDRLRSVGVGLDLIAAAREAVADGVLGYGVVVAHRP